MSASLSIPDATSRQVAGQPPPYGPTRLYSRFQVANPRPTRSIASGSIVSRSQRSRQKPPWRKIATAPWPGPVGSAKVAELVALGAVADLRERVAEPLQQPLDRPAVSPDAPAAHRHGGRIVEVGRPRSLCLVQPDPDHLEPGPAGACDPRRRCPGSARARDRRRRRPSARRRVAPHRRRSGSGSRRRAPAPTRRTSGRARRDRR